ncbi:hypothetical protein, partial [Pseudomonas frederiksbergensis]|uniref:hypothetical protein n=1 Tax=Pseudomonas frederiksbergensis TaxID=104087 RepID=UPI00197E6028
SEVVKNRPKPLHIVKNAVFGCFLSNTFQEHFQPKTAHNPAHKNAPPPLKAPPHLACNTTTDHINANTQPSPSKTSQKRQKKNFLRQSPVNPRSNLKTPPAERSECHFAAPRGRKFPYNADLNGPAIFPYRGEKPV